MLHSSWTGSHYHAGLQYGTALYPHRQIFLRQIAVSPERIDFAQACVPFYQKYCPEILKELQGIADGLQISPSPLISFLFSMYAYTYSARCSCFAFSDSGKALLCRNSDFSPDIKALCDSAHYHLDDTYSFIGNTTAWTQMEDGVNDHGLAVGLTFVYPTKVSPGLQGGILVRQLLETCATVHESIDLLRALPIASSQTITIADQSGQIAVVECNCDKVVVLRPAADTPFVFATNHFTSEEMRPYQYTGDDDCYSHLRYETLRNALASPDSDPLSFAQSLLSGQKGFLCQYSPADGIDTLWSSIYDLSSKGIYRAEGNPSITPFLPDTRL